MRVQQLVDHAFESSSGTIFTYLLAFAVVGAGLTLGGVVLRKAATWMVRAGRPPANG